MKIYLSFSVYQKKTTVQLMTVIIRILNQCLHSPHPKINARTEVTLSVRE